MEAIKKLHSAWRNDSFYMKTTAINGASVFEAGAVGFATSRIAGVGFPRDQAIYSVIFRISMIFVEFIENTVVKKPLLSDGKEDKIIEKFLRFLVKRALCGSLTKNVCPLLGARKIILFPLIPNLSIIKLIFVQVIIEEAIETTIKLSSFLLFPPKPRESSEI